MLSVLNVADEEQADETNLQRAARSRDTLLLFTPLSGEAAMYIRSDGGADVGVEALGK